MPQPDAAPTQEPSAQRVRQVAPQSVVVAAQWPSAQRTGALAVQEPQSAVVSTQAPLHATGRSTGQPLVEHRARSATQLPSGQRAAQVLTQLDAMATQRPSLQRTGVELGQAVHAGSLAQSTSAQSMAVSLSSSVPLVQFSVGPLEAPPPLDGLLAPEDAVPDEGAGPLELAPVPDSALPLEALPAVEVAGPLELAPVAETAVLLDAFPAADEARTLEDALGAEVAAPVEDRVPPEAPAEEACTSMDDETPPEELLLEEVLLDSPLLLLVLLPDGPQATVSANTMPQHSRIPEPNARIGLPPLEFEGAPCPVEPRDGMTQVTPAP